MRHVQRNMLGRGPRIYETKDKRLNSRQLFNKSVRDRCLGNRVVSFGDFLY